MLRMKFHMLGLNGIKKIRKIYNIVEFSNFTFFKFYLITFKIIRVNVNFSYILALLHNSITTFNPNDSLTA